MNKKTFLTALIFSPFLISCSIDNPLGILILNGGFPKTGKNEWISTVKTVSIDPIKEITMKIGDEKLLLPVINNKDGSLDNSNDITIWVSGNPEIASVDKNGLLKGLKEGKTIITLNLNNESKFSKVSVTVTK